MGADKERNSASATLARCRPKPQCLERESLARTRPSTTKCVLYVVYAFDADHCFRARVKTRVTQISSRQGVRTRPHRARPALTRLQPLAMSCGRLWVPREWTRWCATTISNTRVLILAAQIITSKNEVIITNDGATILRNIQAFHPAAKMVCGLSHRLMTICLISTPLQFVDLSAAQDIEAGDGTTSVVVLAGSLLGAAEKMLEKGASTAPRAHRCAHTGVAGMHPTIIAESFLKASVKSVEYLTEMSTPVDLRDRTSLLRAAKTSLNSKVRACRIRDCARAHTGRRSCRSSRPSSRPSR